MVLAVKYRVCSLLGLGKLCSPFSCAVTCRTKMQVNLTAALRSVEKYLNLEKLYVLGTNCGKQLYVLFSTTA